MVLNYTITKLIEKSFNLKFLKQIENFNFSPGKQSGISALLRNGNNKQNIAFIDATNLIYRYGPKIKQIKDIFNSINEKLSILKEQNDLNGIVVLFDKNLTKGKRIQNNNNGKFSPTPNINNFKYDENISESEYNYQRFIYCQNEYNDLLKEKNLKINPELNPNYDENLSIKLLPNHIHELHNKDYKFFVIDIIVEALKKKFVFNKSNEKNDDKFLVLMSYSKYYFIDKSTNNENIERSEKNLEIERMLDIDYNEADQIIPHLCNSLPNCYNSIIIGNDGDLILNCLDLSSERIKIKSNKINDIVFKNDILIIKNLWSINDIKHKLEYYEINVLYKNILSALLKLLNKNYKSDLDLIYYFTLFMRLIGNDYITNSHFPDVGAKKLFDIIFDKNNFNYLVNNQLLFKKNDFILVNETLFTKLIIGCYANSNKFNFKPDEHQTDETIFDLINNNFRLSIETKLDSLANEFDALIEKFQLFGKEILKLKITSDNELFVSLEEIQRVIKENKKKDIIKINLAKPIKNISDILKDKKKKVLLENDFSPKLVEMLTNLIDFYTINESKTAKLSRKLIEKKINTRIVKILYKNLIFTTNYFGNIYPNCGMNIDPCLIKDGKTVFGFKLLNERKNDYGFYDVINE